MSYINKIVAGGVRSDGITCLNGAALGNREKYRENPRKSHIANRDLSFDPVFSSVSSLFWIPINRERNFQ